jgi:uncharacterized RDD family membrane protein YckC
MEPGEPPPPLASIGRRAVARLTDGLIFAVPIFFLLLPFLDFGDSEASFSVPWGVLVAMQAVVAVYEVTMIAWRGQTVGKIAMGVRVVRVDDGQVPSWTYSGIRALVPAGAGAVPGVGTILSLVVYLWAVVDPRRQGLHDKSAGTIVVAAR